MIDVCPGTARGRGTRQVSCPLAREAEDAMTRTAGRDMAAGLTRTSTRRAALVGLLGMGLVAGSIPALASKHHGGHEQSAVSTAEAGQAKDTGQMTPASDEVTAAAGKFKTVKKTFS